MAWLTLTLFLVSKPLMNADKLSRNRSAAAPCSMIDIQSLDRHRGEGRSVRTADDRGRKWRIGRRLGPDGPSRPVADGLPFCRRLSETLAARLSAVGFYIGRRGSFTQNYNVANSQSDGDSLVSAANNDARMMTDGWPGRRRIFCCAESRVNDDFLLTLCQSQKS